MAKIDLIGIDVAKTVFQIQGLDENKKCIIKKKMTRKKLYEFLATLSPCTIVMEACAGSNYLSRKFCKKGGQADSC